MTLDETRADDAPRNGIQFPTETFPLTCIQIALPPSLVAQLTKDAKSRHITRSEYVRRLIMDATGHELAQRLVRPLPLKVAPEVKFTIAPETVTGLWARGFTANQIAARLRKPYKKVLNEIYGEGQIDPDT